MQKPLDEFLQAVTATSNWLSSPAVTAWCEERVKEREQEEREEKEKA